MPDLILSSPIAGTIAEFIDYALVLTIICSLYYLIRFIFFGGETSDDSQARRDKFGQWIDEKKEQRKESEQKKEEAAKKQREYEERRRLLEPAKGFILRAEQNGDGIVNSLRNQTSSGVDGAHTYLHRVETNLHSAQRVLRVARIRAKGEKKEFIYKLYEYVLALEGEVVHHHIRSNMPANPTDSDWPTRVRAVNSHVSTLRGSCGNLMRAIDSFIDEDRAVAPTIATGAAGGMGRGPPAYHP